MDEPITADEILENAEEAEQEIEDQIDEEYILPDDE